MSVQSEIDRISGNVASTYTALSEMGATMPAQQNSDNLPGTVRTVPQGGGTSVQTDWNQTDDTAPDFLKNKPFGDEEIVIVPVGELTLVFEESEGFPIALFNDVVAVNGGDEVTVVWDETTYKNTATYMQGMCFWGNCSMLGLEDTGEPFCCLSANGMLVVYDLTVSENVTRTIGISLCAKKKIDKAYLPQTGTKLYISGIEGPYLYLDAEYTTAVTTSDLLAIIAAGPLVISYADAYFYYPVSSMPDDGCMSVACTVGGTQVKYYTAEYTP